MNTKFKIMDMTYIAVCAALMAVCSWISIPATVQFTLQTMGVCFALVFLGGLKGTISVLVYILLGMVGVPVFSGPKGGLGVLLGTTGGYIIGFIFMGLIYILFEAIFKKHFNIYLKIAASVLGLFICYVFGTAWFMVVYSNTKGAVTLAKALGWCVYPFIIPDLIKLALGFSLAYALRKALKYN